MQIDLMMNQKGPFSSQKDSMMSVKDSNFSQKIQKRIKRLNDEYKIIRN